MVLMPRRSGIAARLVAVGPLARVSSALGGLARRDHKAALYDIGPPPIQAPLARRSRASSSGLPAGRRAGAPVRISPAGPGSAPGIRARSLQTMRPGDPPGLSQSCAGMIGGIARYSSAIRF